MKKSNIILFILIGLMLLTACKDSDQELTISTEEDKATGTQSSSVAEEVKDIGTQSSTVTDVSNYDFSVITVGTGTPKFSDIKAKASTMIQYKGTYYLVDCGDGSNANLLESDFDFKNLDSIFFTHHHLDHTSDFFDIYAQRFLRNDDQIDIIGPPRTSEFVEFFNDVFLDDLLYRKLALKNMDDSYKDVIKNYGNTIEIEGANSFELDELTVTSAEMTHTMYDLAYKFEVDGESIVISGDTSYSENLVTLAKDADILVIDGTLYTKKPGEEESGSNNIDPFYDYGGDFDVEAHLNFEEMVDIAVESNVKILVITHFNEATQEKIDLSIGKIKERFDGQVIYATDMQEIGINTDNEMNTKDEVKLQDSVDVDSLINTYMIVDTNEIEFYSDKAIIKAPEEGEDFYGQDASYEGNLPSYTDNNDGTISDDVTGLMWAQNMGNKMTFDEAIDFANSSQLGGYDDWRIPTIKELYSLIQFDGQVLGEKATDKLFINTDYFDQPLGDTNIGEREIDAQTWSSTKYTGTTMNNNITIFGVNFIDGRIKGYSLYNRREQSDNTMYFRLVRGNTAYGENNFVDNGDGTITDLASGLTWQQDDSGDGMDWEEALAYAENLDYGGYDDWRLPNAKELQSIVDYSRSLQATSSAAIDEVFNTSSILNMDGELNYPYYWSSTSHLDGKNPYGYGVYIAFGQALGVMNDVLLDVHGAGAQRSDPKSGDASDYPEIFGPQGDVRIVYNYVRCVRDN